MPGVVCATIACAAAVSSTVIWEGIAAVLLELSCGGFAAAEPRSSGSLEKLDLGKSLPAVASGSRHWRVSILNYSTVIF
jgi:hypothetical protein